MLFSAEAGYWRPLTKEADEIDSLDENLNAAFSANRGERPRNLPPDCFIAYST